MHLLVLENKPSSACGGQELSLFDACTQLAARGHMITLLHVEQGDLLPRYREFCASTVRVSGYSVDRRWPLGSALGLARDVGRVRSDNIGVIYGNQYQDSLFARLIAARLKRPFVCHLRLAPPERFCAQYRWGMRKAARVIATSQHTRAEYVAKGFEGDRVAVVHNGVDLDRYAPPTDREKVRAALGFGPDSFAITYAGRIDWDKGLDVLLRAVARLPGRASLLIAGLPSRAPIEEGERCLARLRALAHELGLGERCRFPGHVADVPALFGAADVAVLPSTCSESFGRVLIEAMACGTPAIGTRVGGVPEVLTGEFAEWLVTPGDESDLAGALERLQVRRTADPGIGRRCRAHVATHFPLDRTIDALERVLIETADEWTGGVRRFAAPALC